MTRSFFLEVASYVAKARGDYGRALRLAEDAARTCRDFRLGTARTASSLCCQAAAAIGLRRFRDAASAVEEVARLDVRDARHIVGERWNLHLKLLISKGRCRSALDLAASFDLTDVPAAVVAESAGLLAIAAAGAGEFDRSRVEAQKGWRLKRTAEAHFYLRFAAAILPLAAGGDGDRARRGAMDVFAETAHAEMLDAFVIAYRAWPALLAAVAQDENAFPVVARVVRAANDQELARRAGVAIVEVEADERISTLTRREQEVLRLMTDGLSNAEIAKRLFITESTAKQHVHKILEKLGARTRLQAVLMAK
ncbi:MAG: LuxR C-terminal-related transcriptional regulator [Actinomycetota bacterium]|nr:LuxR C-terminal-related transcriptional regulator [Actinomycetota bacterium]